ncbi:MAG: orotate phosphoribosyltransferase [Bacteroidia bacterium]|nr:orotate phosphoribosyltransferase [Bacteroidia bacterium]
MLADKVAEILLNIKAVRLSVEAPFTWASGWKSPIYCDNRKVLSFPAQRRALAEGFAAEVRSRYPEAEAVAGVATGAIAWGALAAELLELPFVYVRSEAKGHGLRNLIEGHIAPGTRCVVIEDLISTGKSSVQAVRALQEAEVQVLGTVAIFNYGFPEAEQAFGAAGVPFHSLTGLKVLLDKAVAFHYLRPDELETVLQWQQAPAVWKGPDSATF